MDLKRLYDRMRLGHRKHHFHAHVSFHHYHTKEILVSNPISTNVPVQATLTLTNNGTAVTPTAFSWGTSAPAVATVDSTTGVVTPVGAGSTTITAQYSVLSNDGVTTLTGNATGTVNVLPKGDNLVASVDFTAIS